MILNRDCFFYKKSDFINRQSELSPDSIVYIADTHQIYTHGAFFECALTTAKVKELIENYGYLTPADLPELTGGSAPLEGTYIDGVTVDGHNITIHRENFSEINVGSASKLENPRDIILSGDISGQVSFDGTKDVTIETTVHNSETADRLTNPRTISLIGQSSGSAYFDGSRDISIETTTNQLNSIDANNQSLNDLVTLNGYLGNLFYGVGGNTSLNKPENVDSFGLFTFKSASGNYSTQILGSSLDRIYVRSGADSSLGNWNTLAYLTDNVASATKLQNTRTFTISDGQHTGSSSNFDGTSNVTLNLPDIINADIVGNLTGDITGNVTGDLYGNADTATKLETGRNINGTLFDGTKDIITNQWGTARNIGIVNSDGSGTPIPVSVNGGSNVNLKLPANIKADITGDLNGNASTTSKLQTPVDINLSGDATGSVSFDGSKDVTINVDVNTASKLENAFTLTLGGDTTGSVSIDGSKNVTLSVTVKDNSHNHTVSNITDLNSTWDQYLTGGGLYERNLVMNGTTYPVFTDVSGASTVTWYAPTTAGTSGYILQSTGGTPQWISISTLGSLLDGRYVNVSGDTMTGGLTLPGGQSSVFNSQGLMFSGNTGRIGTNNKGELGIYAKADIYIRPDSSTDSSDSGLYISSDVITYNNYPLLHSNNYTNYVYSKSQSDDRYVKKTGDTMTGKLTLPSGLDAFNDASILFGNVGRIGGATGGLGIYSTGGSIYLCPNQTTTLDKTKGLVIAGSTLKYNQQEVVTEGNTIALTGDVTGSATFNSSGNASITTTVANNSHTHTLSNISNLNATWAGLLDDTPTAYVTRWPAISEVTGKQNLVIKLNGGTTEGNNQFTYNGTVAKTVNITPSAIGASSSNHTHNTSISSNATTNLSVTAGGTTDTIADLYATYADQLRTPRTISLTGDVTGSVSFNGSKDVSITTTVKDDSHSHSNYAQKDGSNATGTWPISVSGNAAGLVNSDPDSFVNRLVYHIEVGGEVGSTEGGGAWGVPSASQDAQYGQGQYIRMGWSSGTYYTDIYTGPNNAGAARGLQWRQVVANIVVNATHREGWRLLLDTLNYSATLDARYLLKSSYTAADVLAKLKTVDGSGSGLDADLLDGTHKSGLFTALSSTSSTNLSITIGGTTKTITDLYANYADTAGSVSWTNITNKPSTFTPSAHTHDYLSGWSDTRSTVETPNSYNKVFEIKGIKQSSTYGISSGSYVQVFGYRGCPDSSGGNAHEFALADNGRIYHRDGATTSWGSWDTVAYLTDIPSLDGYATENWVENNFDWISVSTNTTSGVLIATLTVSGRTHYLYAPTAEEVSLTWDSISGKPSCYTPCDHGHHFDDITFNNTGTNRQYLAGDGRFYTISYNEISGTPAQYSLPILSNSTLGGAKINLKHTTSCTFESSHTSTSSSVTVNARTTVSGRYYAVEADSNGYLFVNVPWEAGESGGGITSINDAAGSSTATGYLITDASGSTVYRRALKSSDITDALGYTPSDTDTKNTAGATNNTGKLYLVGALSQSANPQTYSESGCYISGGQLYSDGELVATQSWVENNISTNVTFSMNSTNATNLSLTINGTTENITNLYADSVDGYDISVVSTTPSVMLTSTIYFVY